MGENFNLSPNNNVYRLVDDGQRSTGSIIIRIQTPESLIQLTVDIVKRNVPLVVALEMLEVYNLYVNTVTDHLYNDQINWTVLLVRKLGHVDLTWGTKDLYHFYKKRTIKIHRGFSYPSNQKLFNLLKILKIAILTELIVETKKALKK